MANAEPLASHRILIMATDGFEQSELEVPLERLQAAGAEVDIASLKSDDITGWDGDDWGDDVEVDLKIADVNIADYAALVLPGGQINPDLLRVDDAAVALIRDFDHAGKPIAAICHAPWLLIEAGLAKSKRLTSYKSIRIDVINAGAEYVDEAVVVDGNIITSRCPDDLPAFCDAIIEAVAESRVEA
ncbi:type 1 glutamine amidotransferase domain-containing protein [Sphingopyxis sp.]|uniref:type 1 glutamine amidotransferase domain-containing protein n=1 Tax=Sphingopyxis sp. TaxID=1908224 RepID=UPI001D275FED|nr:type 1 glutamine amidotransferase domain-containing protein [Sphingopyxis sp.]MBW8294801.1 type 1 glutamine amidotransferase [Sphingopyxis sp.]